jgi:hypothetical protein
MTDPKRDGRTRRTAFVRYPTQEAARGHLAHPLLADQRLDRRRQRHVVQTERHVVAALVGPVEELQHALTGRRAGLVLVDQDEGRAGDRPGLSARLVEQQQVVAWRLGPVGARRGGGEVGGFRGRILAGLVLHQGIGGVVLLGVGVFDIADGADGLFHEGRDTVIALATQARGPLDRVAGADLAGPGRALHRQVGGEQEAGARAVRAVNDGDRQVRQGDALVEGADLRVVPLLDVAQIDRGEQRSGQVDLARLDARKVHHRDHAAHDCGELVEARAIQLFELQRLVGRAEIDGLGLDLLDAAAGTDGLVVQTDPGLGLIGFGPFGVDWRGERGPGARQVGGLGGRTHHHHRPDGGRDRLQHPTSPLVRRMAGAFRGRIRSEV